MQVEIYPEVASCKLSKAIIIQLIKVYRESDLGMKSPVFDGARNLYTASPLPFAVKDFNVTLVLEDEATSNIK